MKKLIGLLAGTFLFAAHANATDAIKGDPDGYIDYFLHKYDEVIRASGDKVIVSGAVLLCLHHENLRDTSRCLRVPLRDVDVARSVPALLTVLDASHVAGIPGARPKAPALARLEHLTRLGQIDRVQVVGFNFHRSRSSRRAHAFRMNLEIVAWVTLNDRAMSTIVSPRS